MPKKLAIISGRQSLPRRCDFAQVATPFENIYDISSLTQ